MLASALLVAQLAAQLTAAAGCTVQPALEIRHVHVIDVLTGAIFYDATVTIDGGRICRIAHRTERAAGALHQIDGRGRYALPGLWLNPVAQDNTYSLLGYGITQTADGALPNAAPDQLYDELVQLNALGITPLQVLQELTWNAAQRAAMRESGLLATGFEASLILLEENPLQDLTHLRGVSLVIQRGQPYGLVELARARAGRTVGWQPFAHRRRLISREH